MATSRGEMAFSRAGRMTIQSRAIATQKNNEWEKVRW